VKTSILKNSCIPRVFILTIIILTFLSAESSIAQNWDPGFDVPGVSTSVGGIFTLGNKVLIRQSRSMLAYDLESESWTDAGAFADLRGVEDVAQLPDGTVIIGGSFTEVEGQPIQYIAALMESGWQPIGSPLNGPVRHIVFAGDRLYIGGDFNMAGSNEINHVAEWSGSDWSPLEGGLSRDGFTGGETILSGGLQFVNDILYAGGSFDMAGNTEVSNVASWDGTAWSDVGGGLPDSHVYSTAEWNGKLVVGGDFDGSGMSLGNLASWDGLSWNMVGAGLPGQVGSVEHIAVLNTGVLYLTTSGSTSMFELWKYDGNEWITLPLIHQNRLPSKMEVVSEDRLWVGMSFIINPDDPRPDQYLFEWKGDGEGWATVDRNGRGLDGPVFTAINAPDGSVVVGGNFAFAGPTPARSVARWDGSEWTAFGSGLLGDVNALAFDSQGTLYAGGQFFFSGSGSTQVNHIARWNGSSWESLASGVNYMPNLFQTVVLDILPNGDEIWLVGIFDTAGGVETRYHAKWNILTETWISSELDLDEPAASISRDEDGSLLMSGWFDSAGGVDGLGRMLRLRDGVVERIGNGSSSLFVRTLFRYADTLYAAGLFENQPIGKLDGETWVPAGNGLSGVKSVRDFCVTPNNRLFAVGQFTAQPYDGQQFEDTFVAVLKDGVWSASSSGRINGSSVNACMARGDDLLLFGDFFSAQAPPSAGGAVAPSFNIAQLIDARVLLTEPDFSIPSAAEVVVYPNPVSGVLNVRLPSERHARVQSIRIYDLAGRLIHSEDGQDSVTGSFQVNASQILMTSGTYVLVVDFDGSRVRQKFVYVRQ